MYKHKPKIYIDSWSFPKNRLMELSNMGYEVIAMKISNKITTKDLVQVI